MEAYDYIDDNHYETDMNRVEEPLDPHERVAGLPDDRMEDDADFEVNPELSATNL